MQCFFLVRAVFIIIVNKSLPSSSDSSITKSLLCSFFFENIPNMVSRAWMNPQERIYTDTKTGQSRKVLARGKVLML